MKELVYKSQAKLAFSSADIKSLLEKSRKRNTAKNITGILLFDNRKNFIQLLEGDDDDVDTLYNRIKSDPRHHRVVLIHEDECVRRTFKNWSMEYLYLDSLFSENMSDSPYIDDEQKEHIMESFVSIITQHFSDHMEDF
jgi:hypothetical protein